jgi:hypothetical protein
LRSCVANAASQILCDQLSFCFRRLHLSRKSPHFVGELVSSFRHQHVGDRKPSPLYLFSGLKKSRLALLDSKVSLEKLSGHRFGARTGVVGFTPLLPAPEPPPA